MTLGGAQLLVEVAVGQLVARVAVDHAVRQRDRLVRALHPVRGAVVSARARRVGGGTKRGRGRSHSDEQQQEATDAFMARVYCARCAS